MSGVYSAKHSVFYVYNDIRTLKSFLISDNKNKSWENKSGTSAVKN